MPVGWFSVVQKGLFDWGLRNEPDDATDARIWPQPRGRVLGGTSSINGMMYSRGCRADYDGWAALGLQGWSYAEVLPYFKRSECNWRGSGPYHGSGGPLTVSKQYPHSSLHEPILAAASSLGFPNNPDFNGESPAGFGLPDFTVRGGRRNSAADAFLHPVTSRSNLTIVSGAQLTRVIIAGARAIGVEYVSKGRQYRASADREVILSMGAYHSPPMLMLSGIGEATQLRELGIPVVADLPNVGRNLQDHPMVGMAFASAQPVTFEKTLRFDKLAAAGLAWALSGSGPLASQPMTAQGFLNILGNSPCCPDVQVQILHASMMAKPWFPGWRKGAGHHFSVGALQLQPDSRGTVALRSSDPFDPPRLHLRLLKSESDRQAAREMLKFIRTLMETAPASDLVAGCLSDSALDAYVRATIITGSHPVGTCAMAVNGQGVVDAALRVHGIEGLRVVDASVMPRIPRGNTNAPTIMIAEKASDLILGNAPLKPAVLGAMGN
jgi:choline dehydrogenase